MNYSNDTMATAKVGGPNLILTCAPIARRGPGGQPRPRATLPVPGVERGELPAPCRARPRGWQSLAPLKLARWASRPASAAPAALRAAEHVTEARVSLFAATEEGRREEEKEAQFGESSRRARISTPSPPPPPHKKLRPDPHLNKY